MFLTWRFPNQAKTARHDGRNDIPHVGDFCSNTTDSAAKSMSGRKKTRVDLIVSNGQSQLPSQLQLSCVVAGDANLQSLSKMAADRVCDRIRSNHAVELVVRDAHDRPPHRDKGVRPARIRDALFLARVRLFALILDVEFRFGPAQVAAEIRFPRKRPCRRACEYLVVHTRNAQPMTPVHHRQTERERLLGFARGCRIVGQVACDARHFSRTAQRRITSCEVFKYFDGSKRLHLIGGSDPGSSRLIRTAQFVTELQQGDLAFFLRRDMHEGKSSRACEHAFAQPVQGSPLQRGCANMRLARLRHATSRRARHQDMGRQVDRRRRMARPYELDGSFKLAWAWSPIGQHARIGSQIGARTRTSRAQNLKGGFAPEAYCRSDHAARRPLV